MWIVESLYIGVLIHSMICGTFLWWYQHVFTSQRYHTQWQSVNVPCNKALRIAATVLLGGQADLDLACKSCPCEVIAVTLLRPLSTNEWPVRQPDKSPNTHFVSHKLSLDTCYAFYLSLAKMLLTVYISCDETYMLWLIKPADHHHIFCW